MNPVPLFLIIVTLPFFLGGVVLKRTRMTLVTSGPLENDLVRMASNAGKRKEIETLTDCPVPLNHKSPLLFITNRLRYSVSNRSSGY